MKYVRLSSLRAMWDQDTSQGPSPDIGIRVKLADVVRGPIYWLRGLLFFRENQLQSGWKA